MDKKKEYRLNTTDKFKKLKYKKIIEVLEKFKNDNQHFKKEIVDNEKRFYLTGTNFGIKRYTFRDELTSEINKELDKFSNIEIIEAGNKSLELTRDFHLKQNKENGYYYDNDDILDVNRFVKNVKGENFVINHNDPRTYENVPEIKIMQNYYDDGKDQVIKYTNYENYKEQFARNTKNLEIAKDIEKTSFQVEENIVKNFEYDKNRSYQISGWNEPTKTYYLPYITEDKFEKLINKYQEKFLELKNKEIENYVEIIKTETKEELKNSLLSYSLEKSLENFENNKNDFYFSTVKILGNEYDNRFDNINEKVNFVENNAKEFGLTFNENGIIKEFSDYRINYHQELEKLADNMIFREIKLELSEKIDEMDFSKENIIKLKNEYYQSDNNKHTIEKYNEIINEIAKDNENRLNDKSLSEILEEYNLKISVNKENEILEKFDKANSNNNENKTVEEKELSTEKELDL